MIGRVGINFGNIIFHVSTLVLVISIIAVVSCHGSSKLDIAKYPSYFSVAAWEAIVSANERNNGEAGRTIIAVIDGDVDYERYCLRGKNNKNLQQGIEGKNEYAGQEGINHATAIVGLILGDHCELPLCRPVEEKYQCTEEKIVVAGIVQDVTIVNAPSLDGELMEKSVKNLISAIDLSAEEKKEIATWGEAAERNLPVRIILNLSEGPNTREVMLEGLQEKLLMQVATGLDINKEQAYDDLFLAYYLANNMTWVFPDIDFPQISRTELLEYWAKFQSQKESLEAEVNRALEYRDNIMTSYKDAVNNHILPRKDYFVIVVAAGNDGEEQTNLTAGPLWKVKTDNEPVIGVAAGCGDGYRRLCSLEQGDMFDSGYMAMKLSIF